MAATPRPVVRRPRTPVTSTSQVSLSPEQFLPSPSSSSCSGGPHGSSSPRSGNGAGLSSSSKSRGSEFDEPMVSRSVDVMQFGILGWKEYALLKFSDYPRFNTSAVGKELIIESAMWELQQKLKTVEAWADDVENAAFDLERSLRLEKKARLRAEAKLRELQMVITKSAGTGISQTLLELSKESLVRSPSRGTSPIHGGAAVRSASPTPLTTSPMLLGALDSRDRASSPFRHTSPTPMPVQDPLALHHHQHRHANPHGLPTTSPARRPSRHGRSQSPEVSAAPVVEVKKASMRTFLSSFLGKSTSKHHANTGRGVAGGGAESSSAKR